MQIVLRQSPAINHLLIITPPFLRFAILVSSTSSSSLFTFPSNVDTLFCAFLATILQQKKCLPEKSCQKENRKRWWSGGIAAGGSGVYINKRKGSVNKEWELNCVRSVGEQVRRKSTSEDYGNDIHFFSLSSLCCRIFLAHFFSLFLVAKILREPKIQRNRAPPAT